MKNKKTIWISISLAVFILAFFSIVLLNRFDMSVDGNEGTALEETNNHQKAVNNIPEYFSNILSKEHLIENASTGYSVLYGVNNNREMYVFSAPIIEENESGPQLLENNINGTNEEFFTQNQHFNVSFEKDHITMANDDVPRHVASVGG